MARGKMARQPSKSGKQAGVRDVKIVSRSAKKSAGRGQAPVSKQPAKPKRTTIPASKRPSRRAKGYNPLAEQRVHEILTRLDKLYPNVTCALHHRSAWELVVATILSAQCTDVRVNLVTPGLFAKYPTPQAFAAIESTELEPEIRTTGFFRNKAKSVVGAARKLIQDFGGVVPDDMEKLLTLPGVARKTANVVLGNAFGIVEGVVVDTHVGRISRRLGFTTSADPVRVERDLMLLLPQSAWLDYTHRVILHGRAICKAPRARCALCTMADLCPSAGVDGA